MTIVVPPDNLLRGALLPDVLEQFEREPADRNRTSFAVLGLEESRHTGVTEVCQSAREGVI
jgi:hypothetical protein